MISIQPLPPRMRCTLCDESYNPASRDDAPICDHGRCPVCNHLLRIAARNHRDSWTLLVFTSACAGLLLLVTLIRLIGGAS